MIEILPHEHSLLYQRSPPPLLYKRGCALLSSCSFPTHYPFPGLNCFFWSITWASLGLSALLHKPWWCLYKGQHTFYWGPGRLFPIIPNNPLMGVLCQFLSTVMSGHEELGFPGSCRSDLSVLIGEPNDSAL